MRHKKKTLLEMCGQRLCEWRHEGVGCEMGGHGTWEWDRHSDRHGWGSKCMGHKMGVMLGMAGMDMD